MTSKYVCQNQNHCDRLTNISKKMSEKISLKSSVELGVVPTHIKFVGGLVPDDEGRLPRNENGELIVVNEMKHLTEISPVKIGRPKLLFFLESMKMTQMI